MPRREDLGNFTSREFLGGRTKLGLSPQPAATGIREGHRPGNNLTDTLRILAEQHGRLPDEIPRLVDDPAPQLCLSQKRSYDAFVQDEEQPSATPMRLCPVSGISR